MDGALSQYRGASSGANAQSTAERETLISELNSRLSSTSGTLEHINERIGRVVSRALGDLAPNESKGNPRPVRSGAIGVLMDQMDNISAQLGDLQALTSRLETLA